MSWIKDKQVLTLVAPTNFNYVYGQKQAGITETTQLQTGTFYARILYIDTSRASSEKDNLISQTVFAPGFTYARLTIGPEAKVLVDDSKEIYMDGIRFEKNGSWRPRGLFDVDYYSIYLKEIK